MFSVLLQPGMEVSLDTYGRRRVGSVLLICLFVVKAAADCLKPEEKTQNIILTNEALLINEFPEGATVTLECANGHVQESGSGIITCMNGEWSEPDLICIKKDCGPPDPQPNMSFDMSDGTLFGASVLVVCNKGFQVAGSSYKQCFAAGWRGRATCEIVKCEPPPDVDNGRSSWDSQDEPKYGEIINYVCNEGFTLTGKAHIMCSETGDYDSQPPECIDVTTENIPSTTMVTPTSMPPVQEVPTSTDSSGTATSHRDKLITTSATDSPCAATSHRDKLITTSATDSPCTATSHRDKLITSSVTSATSPSTQGGSAILTDDKAAPASVTPATSLEDKHDQADTYSNIGNAPVIVSVTCVVVAVCVSLVFLHKFLLRRKGTSSAPGLI
uniref:complement decay-accelerating factor isoform X2 n=1 Tax=Scatophagus argus TaxID=75038 RepID=UPI001ED8495F|nr:complement decay-accelerating factor isoform X2 [Scatophagus argus]